MNTRILPILENAIILTVFEVNDYKIRIENVIECKWSKDKPWVIFTSDYSIHPGTCIAQSFGSLLGKSLLWHVAGNEELYKTSFFNSPQNAGFGGRQAFTNGKDLFFNSMQSITTVTELLTQSYDSNLQPFILPKIAVVAFPVIVVDGQLFEAKYNVEEDRIILNETNHIRLHWKGADSWKFHSTVDIVTKSHVGDFVSLRSAELVIVKENLINSLDNIVECFNEGSLAKLNNKEAPRGFPGLPSILHNLQQLEPIRSKN